MIAMINDQKRDGYKFSLQERMLTKNTLKFGSGSGDKRKEVNKSKLNFYHKIKCLVFSFFHKQYNSFQCKCIIFTSGIM